MIVCIRRSFELLYDQKKNFLLLCIVRVMSIPFLLWTPFILSRIISQLSSNANEDIYYDMLLLIMSWGINLLFQRWQYIYKQKVEKNARVSLKKELLERILKGWDYGIGVENSALVTEIIYSDANAVVDLSIYIIEICIDFIYVLVTSYIIIQINTMVAIILCVFFLFTTIFTIMMTKKLKRYQLILKKENDIHFKFARDIVKNAKYISLSNSNCQYIRVYNQNLEEVKNKTIQCDNLAWKIQCYGKIMEYIQILLLLLIGGHYILAEMVSYAEFIIFFSYSKMFGNCFSNLLKMNINIHQTMISVNRVLELYDKYDSCYEKRLNQARINQRVELMVINNVTFGYGEKIVLMNINVEIRDTGCTLILGKNGAGKSTLLKIMCGLLKPDTGEVLVNGINLHHIQKDIIKNIVMFVPQDENLFDLSIRENILSYKGAENVSYEELIEVCKKVKIDKDILELKDGFDTLISDVKDFSFGQKKKMLLARALLRPSQILLLDEPLAGIDNISQEAIVEVIREISEKKIVVIATHKKELYNFADQVIELSE